MTMILTTWAGFLISVAAAAGALLAVVGVITLIWNIPTVKTFRARLHAGLEQERAKELDAAFERNINGSLVAIKSDVNDIKDRLEKGDAKMDNLGLRIDELEKSEAYITGLAEGLRKSSD